MPTEDASAGKELFRSRIRQERERRAWTQAELADRIGSNRINVSRWENGPNVPGPYYRQKLAELFEKSIQELGFFFSGDAGGSTGEFYPEQYTEKQRESTWHIPYRPNQFFTGRREILQGLRTVFARQRSLGGMLALSGLGGVGKTQIAIEYAHIYRQSYRTILWVNAFSRDTISSDLVGIADVLKLSQQEPTELIGEVVKNWLHRNNGWLLILDNADDFEAVVDFLPSNGTGDILLTTRKLVVWPMAQRIVVENLPQEDGVALLLRRARLLEPGAATDSISSEDHEHAARIVDEMGGLPLALDQAGAYIEETYCGLAQYLERYTMHRAELLKRRGGFSPEHPESVATTWQISFGSIQKEWPASAELLYLCAFLSSESIPEELLVLGAPTLGPLLSRKLTDRLNLDDMLRPLHLYSLIQRVPETGSLSIHRLVQTILRQNLPAAQQKQWAKHIIQALDRAFPEPENKNWELCQRLLAQVQPGIKLSEEYGLILPEMAKLCQRAGEYALDRAFFRQADEFLQKAIAVYEQLSLHEGERSHAIDIAITKGRLGELYRILGRYAEAENLVRSALATYERWEPENRVDTVTMLTSLGELFHNVRQYKSAEQLFKQALDITKVQLGPDHYANAVPLHHLARLYVVQERYEEAEGLFRQVLQFQASSDDYKIEMAITLNNLATLYRAQNKYDDAEALLRQTLDIEEKLLGRDNPRTATALHNLGIVYMKQENYRDAETYLEQALAIKGDVLGFEHEGTIRTMTNLAYVYRKQKRFGQARSLLKKALANNEKLEQANTAVVLRNLASVYFDERDYEEAERYYLRALAVTEKHMPGALVNKKRVLDLLIELYKAQGNDEEAAKYRQQRTQLQS